MRVKLNGFNIGIKLIITIIVLTLMFFEIVNNYLTAEVIGQMVHTSQQINLST